MKTGAWNNYLTHARSRGEHGECVRCDDVVDGSQRCDSGTRATKPEAGSTDRLSADQ